VSTVLFSRTPVTPSLSLPTPLDGGSAMSIFAFDCPICHDLARPQLIATVDG
jgi:hypothetical protein